MGKVICTQVYMEYDSTPLLAVGMRDEDLFFMILAAETEYTLVYLYAKSAEEEWKNFSSDPLAKNATLRLLEASDELWVVSFTYLADSGKVTMQTSYSRVKIEDLPAAWLPELK